MLQKIFYSQKVAIGNLVLGLAISAFLFIFFDLSFWGMIVFVYAIVNTALSVRWLMRINNYELERAQRTQDEALRQSMAVQMTMMPKGP